MCKEYQICEQIAIKAHKGQTRHDGVTPYYVHPKRVSLLCPDDITRCIAILHDVVEDTEITLADLKDHKISKSIIKSVDAITKRKNENYDDYLIRVKTDENARIVKIADLLDNMTDRVSYSKMEKYKNAVMFLSLR